MSRIIIKVGTKVLTKKDGSIDQRTLINLVSQIAAIREQGTEVLLVSSGAVGSGRTLLRTSPGNDRAMNNQLYAALGQPVLMHLYAEYLRAFDILAAQVLVTKDDFRDKTHAQNMETCIANILANNILPIINENDVIAVQELLFTDNDELTALLALQQNVDAVYILSSVAGIYAGNPSAPKAHILPTITTADLHEVEQYITTDTSDGGRGGMHTKLLTARKLMAAGIRVHLMDGKEPNAALRVHNGEQLGTTCIPGKRARAHKRRIAHGHGLAKGSITVNACLEKQLQDGTRARSILPVGLTATEGTFAKGDLIAIHTERGRVIGYGLSRVDATTAKSTLGAKGAKPVVHYNDLFLFN